MRIKESQDDIEISDAWFSCFHNDDDWRVSLSGGKLLAPPGSDMVDDGINCQVPCDKLTLLQRRKGGRRLHVVGCYQASPSN